MCLTKAHKFTCECIIRTDIPEYCKCGKTTHTTATEPPCITTEMLIQKSKPCYDHLDTVLRYMTPREHSHNTRRSGRDLTGESNEEDKNNAIIRRLHDVFHQVFEKSEAKRQMRQAVTRVDTCLKVYAEYLDEELEAYMLSMARVFHEWGEGDQYLTVDALENGMAALVRPLMVVGT